MLLLDHSEDNNEICYFPAPISSFSSSLICLLNNEAMQHSAMSDARKKSTQKLDFSG